MSRSFGRKVRGYVEAILALIAAVVIVVLLLAGAWYVFQHVTLSAAVAGVPLAGGARDVL